ncbi:hypothetical protein K503DRAFT_870575 [Rhizopogon vinicolor AM-OR11-026]|uniref:Uncharacterized protein n=1 Tax=Rhizopogon vinicolor AM-OR11-026 TaxID=1314800 RepID=A0A1B7MG74_9AGAM|nr:hypothetical protein K503DRAFT_870575 [Rhizopogon vinicolor AM-OR11-026]
MATWTRQVEEDTRLVAIAAQAKQGQLEQECLRSEQEAEVEYFNLTLMKNTADGIWIKVCLDSLTELQQASDHIHECSGCRNSDHGAQGCP